MPVNTEKCGLFETWMFKLKKIIKPKALFREFKLTGSTVCEAPFFENCCIFFSYFVAEIVTMNLKGLTIVFSSFKS